MDKVSNDFEFLETVLCEFVSQKHITNRLNAIYSCDITGWENWLQVELGLFFNEHPEIKEWNREQRHDLDKRKHSIHNTAAIDFYIRQKYKQSAIPLEIKQHFEASVCINSMANDIEKFEKIKQSDSITDRALWCMGIHRHVEEDYARRLVANKGFDKYVLVYPIKKTEYMMTLF